MPSSRPIPDAQAICTFAVPELAPPYDDADPSAMPSSATEPLPSVCRTDVPDAGEFSVPSTSMTGAWPSQFAQVLSETLAGARPPSQLTPWTTEQARQRISQLGPMLAAARQPRVRRVLVTSPVQGVLEMTVIVDVGARSRAVAVRLERSSPADGDGDFQTADQPSPRARARPGGWLCTAIEAA